MSKKYHTYLVEVQYLGFRYHGWQKQGDSSVKTVQGIIDRCLKFLFGAEVKFKTLGSSRTDSGVSALGSFFEIFSDTEIEIEELVARFNQIAPDDIRFLNAQEIGAQFNVIQAPKEKEYQYLFAIGEKMHPFCAPYMTHVKGELNIELMQEAATCFVGLHNFYNYAYKVSEESTFERTVDQLVLERNTHYTANFFPEDSFIIKVKGKGFLRYQVRKMVGALFQVGKGEMTIETLKQTLLGKEYYDQHISPAPANGLILANVEYNE